MKALDLKGITSGGAGFLILVERFRGGFLEGDDDEPPACRLTTPESSKGSSNVIFPERQYISNVKSVPGYAFE